MRVVQALRWPFLYRTFFWLGQPESVERLFSLSVSPRPPRDKPPRDVFEVSIADPPAGRVNRQFRVCRTNLFVVIVLAGPATQRPHNLPDSGPEKPDCGCKR